MCLCPKYLFSGQTLTARKHCSASFLSANLRTSLPTNKPRRKERNAHPSLQKISQPLRAQSRRPASPKSNTDPLVPQTAGIPNTLPSQVSSKFQTSTTATAPLRPSTSSSAEYTGPRRSSTPATLSCGARALSLESSTSRQEPVRRPGAMESRVAEQCSAGKRERTSGPQNGTGLLRGQNRNQMTGARRSTRTGNPAKHANQSNKGKEGKEAREGRGGESSSVALGRNPDRYLCTPG